MNHLQITSTLYDYMLDISLREHETLQALREETAKLPLALMQVAPEQGQFLQFMVRLLGVRKILEIGTFTGYSALAMALALPHDGELITCDINRQWTDIAHPFWQKAGVSNKIDLRINPAIQTLKTLLEEGHKHSFDFIFIDADKTNYVEYYELSLQLISPRGLIAIDNIFWAGDVINPLDTSAQTREIRKLNAYIKADDRVHISLLAIADGLFLIHPRINQKEFFDEATLKR